MKFSFVAVVFFLILLSSSIPLPKKSGTVIVKSPISSNVDGFVVKELDSDDKTKATKTSKIKSPKETKTKKSSNEKTKDSKPTPTEVSKKKDDEKVEIPKKSKSKDTKQNDFAEVTAATITEKPTETSDVTTPSQDPSQEPAAETTAASKKSKSGEKQQEFTTSKPGSKSWKLPNFNGETDAYKALYGQHQTGTDPKWRSIVNDPLGGSDKVMRVEYGSGSFGSKSNGGQTFYAQPPVDWKNAKKVKFCYDIMFEKGFEFNSAGKVPGLWGGPAENCKDPSTCWSARFMWRHQGAGEIYPTIDLNKQPKGFCANPKQCLNGSGDQGISVGRGSFKFSCGSWLPICQVLRATSSNGEMKVYVNGDSNPVINWENLVYANSGFSGIQFGTFFGGGSDERSPKTQYSYFKNFSVDILE
ncbi:hypothetical protein HK099_004613 [Clydaea vesicula]|uniref:Polysaccharide lyase 14 domain-containing protein n=1 Tax=Clydaea vesicula TaxID=447962 RepID=A0AAD5XY47_9FUNG|nr:hypothetical protein HK099_004613 [Clydaea vesicula]